MHGGLTYLELEERKDALQRMRRLEIWLKKEELVFDHLTPESLAAIRIVLDGRI